MLTDATFSQALSAPKAVVDFWSLTCPYCVTYKPVFEDVASKAPSDILMVTANINDAPKSAGNYNIQGIPATIFLVNGKEVHREEGNLSKEDLQAAMAQAFGGAAPAAQGTPQRIIPQGGAVSAPSSFPWGAVGGVAAILLAGFLVLR